MGYSKSSTERETYVQNFNIRKEDKSNKLTIQQKKLEREQDKHKEKRRKKQQQQRKNEKSMKEIVINFK